MSKCTLRQQTLPIAISIRVYILLCVWVQITPSNPNIFNIILLFVGFAQKHKTHTQLHAYIVVVLPMPWMSMPNRHGIERKMSSFKLSYNGIVYDNAFFGSASQCLCIYTILYSLLCFMHLLTTQTMAWYERTMQNRKNERKNGKKHTHKQNDIFPTFFPNRQQNNNTNNSQSFRNSLYTFHFPWNLL